MMGSRAYTQLSIVYGRALRAPRPGSSRGVSFGAR